MVEKTKVYQDPYMIKYGWRTGSKKTSPQNNQSPIRKNTQEIDKYNSEDNQFQNRLAQQKIEDAYYKMCEAVDRAQGEAIEKIMQLHKKQQGVK